MTVIDLKKIKEAAVIIRNGGIVVYPTETVFGIGCDPLNREACDKVQRLKQRPKPKPFILLADTIDTVVNFAGELDTICRKFAEKFWPGPLTIVIRTSKSLPDYLSGPTGGIAFRVTPHPIAATLSHEFGNPVVSTSANITDQNTVTSYAEAQKVFGSNVEMVLEDKGYYRGVPSTVIDLTTEAPKVLRSGAISDNLIWEVI
ncbi:MAG: threonylcarbamoyl-AMP synthase [Candidatus Latescibacteria bacterium]|nr:threonylcarbamoyl-AMP synthase [Candidatus Latescibacterota bacterium]